MIFFLFYLNFLIFFFKFVIASSTSPYKGIKKKLAPMMNVSENHLHATPVRFFFLIFFFFGLMSF